MVSLRGSVLSSGIGAAALVIIGTPAHGAVFDAPAPSPAAALAAARNGLVTDTPRELAEPKARLLMAEGRAQSDGARQGRARQEINQQSPGRRDSGRRGPPESLPPGPPDWSGGKPPAVPPVSPRRPLG